ncbi:MAG: hypothetical protein U9R16_05490 [Campylobacterota bacterium]|nr:hypothetical protein [Campylobacterota bacterium]
MKELLISEEELKKMFKNKEILDTNNGWFYKEKEVDIIAIHDKEVKYVGDIAIASSYKIREKIVKR